MLISGSSQNQLADVLLWLCKLGNTFFYSIFYKAEDVNNSQNSFTIICLSFYFTYLVQCLRINTWLHFATAVTMLLHE